MMNATVDLTPVVVALAPYAAAAIMGLVILLLGWIGRRFPILAAATAALTSIAARADNQVLEAYITHGITAGVAHATGLPPGQVDVRSAAVAHATAWVAGQMPDRIARLGVTPAQLESRVATLAAAHPAIAGALA